MGDLGEPTPAAAPQPIAEPERAAAPGAPRAEISEPAGRSELGDVARVLAAAFIDDPVWTAIGPHRRGHRAFASRFAFWGIVNGAVRNGARIRVAREPGGSEIVGATISFADGVWPLPDSATLWELPWVLAAGPVPVARGLRDDRAMRATHIDHPHDYLWFIGVEPALHGRGIGRTLMAELHGWNEPGGLPIYLETGRRENAAFYGSMGYAELGELHLPSGALMWRMERPGTDTSLRP
jgi:GNAT superfamily N-acetyltransferase